MKKLFLSKKILLFLPIVAAAFIPLATSALAENELSINGSVIPKAPIISITIDDNTLSYGVVPLGAVDVAPNPDKVINITNTGNVLAKFNIRGSNARPVAAGESEWNLVASSPGLNEYNHKFQIVSASGAVPTSTGLVFIPKEPTTTEFATSVEPESTGVVSLSFRLNTPTTTSGFGQRNFGVVIQAVAQ